MSNFSRFMKSNKIQKENTTYAATKSLVDEEGKPLLWTIRPLSSKDNEEIREACTMDVPITGKPGMFRPKLNSSKYLAKMICASVVEPDLYDSELQDSYGVMKPEDLILEMVNDPGEYAEFGAFIQKFNGFTESLEEKVDEAKN
ncbi:MAG: hypothetical protein KHZ87_07785 [Clostridiales bacterium]|nr:hypothetical protein [Clostridiales bacterium]MDU0938762.1 hypothetical protein [Clostridiales bacterium]MDU1041598.1 hypothetical protein [Clostridiales bacterium]